MTAKKQADDSKSFSLNFPTSSCSLLDLETCLQQAGVKILKKL
jgi:hypothetical protein